MRHVIKVLGPGCAKCKAMMEAVSIAVEQSCTEADLLKVETLEEMMKYNILTTPVLVIDEEIKIKGRVPGIEEVKALLK